MSIRNQKTRKGIPRGVISRLPIYYRYLCELSQAQEKISSSELGKSLNMTAAQIRSDLSYFGSFGLHGYGYRVDELKQHIEEILGLNRRHDLILIGAGNLGRAIASYQNFRRRGFYINAIFDVRPELIGESIADCVVQSVDKLEEYLGEHHCDIAILTTPREASQLICDRLVKCGVKAIWNFSPVHLTVPDDVVVEHIHLTDSLLQLSFKLAIHTQEEYDNEQQIDA